MFKVIEHFQNYLSDYKIVVYVGLSHDRAIFSGNSLSNKKLYLLYETGHYNVITSFKAAMAYVMHMWHTLRLYTQRWQSLLPVGRQNLVLKIGKIIVLHATGGFSVRNIFRILSEKCFQNHLTLKVKGNLVCQWRQVCGNCSFTVTGDNKHEYFKRFCNTCYKNQFSRVVLYVASLKPSKLSDRFKYILFDTECTHDFDNHDGSFEHIRNLICAQQKCSKCEAVDNLSVDYKQFGKRNHLSWAEDP